MYTVEYLSVPYRSYNEDKIIIKDNLFMVLDGATELIKNNLMNKDSNAVWLVEFIEKRINELYHPNLSFIRMMRQIQAEAAELYYEKAPNSTDLPSCGISCAIIKEQDIEIYNTGDCEAFLLYDDKVSINYKTKLSDLDNEALRSLDEQRLNGLTHQQAFQAIQPILLKNRRKMNEVDGYPVFSPTKAQPIFFKRKKEALDGLKSLFLFSDGFAQIYSAFMAYPSKTAFFKTNPNIFEVVEEIKSLADKDPECDTYHRFKKIDDISVIKISFQQ